MAVPSDFVRHRSRLLDIASGPEPAPNIVRPPRPRPAAASPPEFPTVIHCLRASILDRDRLPFGRQSTISHRNSSASPATRLQSIPYRRTKGGRIGPSRAEPSRAGPSRTEPGRADPGPTRAEPSRAEPNRTEPGRAEPSQAEPSRAEPSRAEPSRAEPNRTEPGRAESSQVEPSQAKPSRAKPNRTEPKRAEPIRAKPSRAEPSRAEPSRARPSGAGPKSSQFACLARLAGRWRTMRSPITSLCGAIVCLESITTPTDCFLPRQWRMRHRWRRGAAHVERRRCDDCGVRYGVCGGLGGSGCGTGGGVDKQQGLM